MDAKTIANGILRAVFILAGIVLLAYFLYLIQTVLVYLLLAAVVALIGRPVVVFLRRKLKFPATLAVVTVIVLFLGVFVGLISLFIPLLMDQGKNLSLLDTESFAEKLVMINREINEFLGRSPLPLGEGIDAEQLEDELLKGLDLSFVPRFLSGILGVLGSLSIGLLSVLFISFFFLKDSKLVQNSLLTLVPDNKEEGLIHSMNKIKGMLSRYFLGLIGQILVLFIIYTITLLLVGDQNALVIAFLCALFNIIPWIGPVIALGVMVLLTITSHLGSDFSTVILPNVGWVVLGFAISQLIDNFVSQPLIFAKAIKLHPLEIFLVILVAGLLFGILGMIIAVPGYTAVKVILKEFLAENKIVKRLTRNI